MLKRPYGAVFAPSVSGYSELVSRTDAETNEELTRLSPHHGVTIMEPREVPLGGLRAMTVRRTLPHRLATTIGPWCFLDHYGPDNVGESGGMAVAPHPHTGLQTVSWLFEGEIEHHDSTGANELVTPGSLTLMTAGRGIQHSEVSTDRSTVLHGVQLWVVLPDFARHQDPNLFIGVPIRAKIDDASVALFMGSLPQLGTNPAPVFWPLFGAEITVPAGGQATLEIPSNHELGVLVDTGELELDGARVSKNQLGYRAPGGTQVSLRASEVGPVRLIALGGLPFEESIVMLWNFIGRSHNDIVAYREAWQAGLESGSLQFGHLDHLPALPAPDMPSITLKARP